MRPHVLRHAPQDVERNPGSNIALISVQLLFVAIPAPARYSHPMRHLTKKQIAARRLYLGLLGLACAVFVFFSPSIRFDFTDCDERAQIEHNPLVQSLTARNVVRMFSQRSLASYYPVRILSFAFDYKQWTLNPSGYHLSNVLLHTINVLLVFLLIRRLLLATRPAQTAAAPREPPPAMTGAALLGLTVFALHPLVVEPVTWVAGREELLMVFFTALCFHLHIAAPQSTTEPNTSPAWHTHAFAAGAALACLLACLSNVVGATIPLLVLAFDLTLGRARNTRATLVRHLVRVWPMWVTATAIIVAKNIGLNIHRGPAGVLPDIAMPLGLRILTVFNTYGHNLISLLRPTQLALNYPPTIPESAADPGVLVGLFGALLTGALLLSSRHKNRTLLLGGLWFLIALAPGAQLFAHHIYRADRFFYLPLVGLSIAVAAALRNPMTAPRRRGSVLTLCIPPVLAMAAFSMLQMRYWKDSQACFERVLAINPGSPMAHNNLGYKLVEDEDYEGAIAHYSAALKTNPFYVRAHSNIGFALAKQGHLDQAMRHFSAALAIKPNDAESYRSMGTALMESGDPEAAVAQLSAAVALCPNSLEYRRELALLFARLGRYEKAAEHYSQLLAVLPNSAETHNAFGLALKKTGRLEQAMAHFSAALELRPHLAQAHNNLGSALAAQERYELAIPHFSEAIRTDPTLAEAYSNLGLAQAILGRMHEAARNFSKALDIDPTFEKARHCLEDARREIEGEKDGNHGGGK